MAIGRDLMRWRVVVTGLVLLGFGACSSSSIDDEVVFDEPTTEPRPSTVSGGIADPDETPPAVGVGTPDSIEVVVSPVEEAFGSIVDPTRLSEIYTAAYLAHADATAACLLGEGYDEFRPEPWQPPTPEEFSATSTDDGLAQFGYGVTNGLRAQLEQIDAFGAVTEPESENQRFLEGLDDAERQTFIDILASCTYAAWDAFPLPESYPAAIAEEIAALQEAAAGGAEASSVWREWSACMSEEGFAFETRADAEATVVASAEGAQAVLSKAGEARRQLLTDERSVLDAQIADIEIEERLLVDLDIACADRVDLDTRLNAILFAAEEEWVEANGDRILLLLAEMGTAWYD